MAWLVARAVGCGLRGGEVRARQVDGRVCGFDGSSSAAVHGNAVTPAKPTLRADAAGCTLPSQISSEAMQTAILLGAKVTARLLLVG